MAVIQHGWATPTEADLYFSDERSVTSLWDALTTDDQKNKVLNASYNRLYYNPAYSLPEAGTETAAQLIILIKAQSEMSYYLLMHLEDQDRRKGIQAQGVIQAGIVKEVYDKDMIDEVPIPPIVDSLLKDFKQAVAFGMVDLDRDEDESVNTEVDDF